MTELNLSLHMWHNLLSRRSMYVHYSQDYEIRDDWLFMTYSLYTYLYSLYILLNITRCSYTSSKQCPTESMPNGRFIIFASFSSTMWCPGSIPNTAPVKAKRPHGSRYEPDIVKSETRKLNLRGVSSLNGGKAVDLEDQNAGLLASVFDRRVLVLIAVFVFCAHLLGGKMAEC